MTGGSQPIRNDDGRSKVEKLSSDDRAALEQRLLAKRRRTPKRTSIPRRADGEHVPLSFAQQRMWLLEQMAPGNAAHVIADAILLEGDLDVDVLRRSLEELERRHESLRTTFRVVDGEPIQIVEEASSFQLPVEDLAGDSNESLHGRVRNRVIEELKQPLDLERGPVMRVMLHRTETGAHLLLILVHHIVSDAWSRQVMMAELAQLYAAYSADAPSPLAPPAVQYADFAVWQREMLQGAELERQMTYWREQLAGVPNLEMPTDRPRPALPETRGRHESLVLPRHLTDALRTLCGAEEYTVYMVLLAAVSLLLHRYSGQDDIVVGSPIAGRNRSELEGVVGFFINMLVLRTDLAGDPTGRALLERVRETILAANEHQDVPFEKLVDELHPARDLSRTPFFQVAYEYRRLEPDAPETAGLRMRPVGFALDVTRFDLEFHAWERGDDIGVHVVYRTDLFDAPTIQQILGHLTKLLEGIVTSPDLPISRVELLTSDERRRLIGEWNETDRPFRDDRCLHQWFEQHAHEAPESIALVFEDETLTYEALNRRANRLAHALRARGVGPDSLVGICADRGFDMVVGILGILKAGGAYVPLDPGYPAERLGFMLTDSGVSTLLTQTHLVDTLPAHGAEVLCLDRDVPEDADTEADLPCVTTPENLAYAVYTSGSTGTPKGALLRHRGICNLSEEQARAFGVGPGSRVLQFSSLSFDASTFDIVMALTKGATLFLGRRETLLPGPDLLAFLRRHAISIVTLPPSALAALPVEPLPDLTTITVAGEACPEELVARWAPGRRFFNLYGPTEATIWSTMVKLDATSGPPHIGRPIGNTRIYVLDDWMRPVPVGVPGELYVAGTGLARGYHGRPALTAERFVPNPFSDRAGDRLYRSGDLVRYRADGNLEFLGRIDHQVKLRGFRIELGEIEAVLARHPAVRETTVLCRGDQPGEKQLVAYIVGASDGPPGATELRRYLGDMLPEYMVPAAFVTLDALPVTRNGKIDRPALPAPTTDRTSSATYLAPRSELEGRIVAIWCEVLGVEQVGVHDNFFDLGGHSLRLVQVHGRFREELGCDLSVTDLFQLATVEMISERLRGAAGPATNLRRAAQARIERRSSEARDAIAVIGMSGKFPGAANVETFWSNLRDGVESVRFYSDETLREAGVPDAVLRNSSYVKARPAPDDVDLFDASYFDYTPREAEIMDPQHRIFLECAVDALERAGYDPDRYDGLIAVYAGSSSNEYSANVRSNPAFAAAAAGLPGALGSHPDFLPTRLSYKLNLRGPSINIQTACSTSLVAVHHGCEALLNQQCDMALVGGVAISVPSVGGYLFQEGGIVSPDGHCRTFDARAQGTLRGDGAGLVVLKRLDEALRDKDDVHAVILGTAINNDGSNKMGYTAPSVDGQAEVIAMAQAAAGVEPETITYIEAHGTATPLGDPIEVAALTKVFRERTDRTGFCGLSAVKSNVGHLDAAAGVAGLIKTVLALEHRTLPPSLHYESPNPEIDFENSPFYVITERRAWELEGGTPRRAGVSSFGLGGTNAHAVLEEAPAIAPSDPSRGWQLLVLSAKNEEALDAVAADLAAHLRANESVNLADVAYTLQIGRRQLDCRRAVRCRDVAEAIAALAGNRRELVDDGRVATKARPVTFMFPGQGAQDVNMGVELYREPGVYRDAVDACLAIIDDELGLGLREVIYPNGPPTADQTDALRERLQRTSLAQPALFTVSYALARQWMAWGIEPESMIGHSIGEYVAACVSGVLSLEDAVRLVVARGRLMEAMPSGVMTAVPLPAERVETLLNGAEEDGLWLSVVNAPSMCVVSGRPERITALEDRLSGAGTECRRLYTSHAFHSGLMEGAVEPFVEVVRGVAVNAPRIPYASNVTGDWITEADVRDAGYWGRQIRQTVRFAEGLGRILEDPSRVVLEVGPGTVLQGLAKLHERFGRERVAVSSLGRAGSGESAASAMTGALGQLWAGGVTVDWSRVHGDARRRRVTLPTYPFQRERYWVERWRGGAAAPRAAGAVARRADLAEWFYAPVWRRSGAARRPAAPSPILVFARDDELDRQIVARLEESGRAVVVVRAGTLFQAAGGSYLIDATAPEDYARMLVELQQGPGLPGEVVHLWTLSFEKTHRLSAMEADALDERGLRALLHFARAFEALDTDESAGPLRIDVVTDGAQDVTGRELIQPEKATALGFCRIAPLERSGLSCRGIDLATSDRPAPGANLAEHVAWECLSASDESMVAYRDGRRWVQSFVRVELDAVASEPPSRLRDRGVYLVTGGLGGIGLELAAELARAVQARLILTGRTALPARDGWAAHLAAHDADDALSRRIRAVEAMEAAGAEVMIAEADVADFDQMQAIVAAARERFGRIDGVLHLAGVPGGGATGRAGMDDLARTFAPKVGGIRVLEQLFRETPPDFMVLASSLMTSWGVPGWVDYCAANMYLDAFARRFAADTGTYTVAIDWTRWRQTGMAVELARETGQAMTAQGVSSQEGIEAFRRIIDRFDEAQVLVSEVDFRDAMSPRRMKALADALAGVSAAPEIAPERLHARPKLSTDYDAPRNDTEQKLATIWQGLFGIERIGVHDNFFELGGDSVLGIQIVARAKVAGFALSPNSLFEHQTIAELATVAGQADDAAVAVTVAEQGPVVGDVPLTPIQHWFFEHDFADAHHFNHSNMLAVRTRLSAPQGEEILRALLEHHDALRLRCARDGGPWRQRCAAPAEPVPLEIVDLSDVAEADHRTAIEVRAAELQSSLDLADGPIARFALFDLGPARPQRLLIVIHHLAVDAVSWPILFQDVARLVVQVDRGKPTALPAKTTSFQTWSLRLAEHAQSAALTAELPYWSNLPWDEVAALPVDHPAGDNTMGTCASVAVSLNEDQTRQLLQRAPRASGVQVPEILLTAVTQALAAWTGNRTLLVDVEGHGREPLFDDVDVTRTVGWFTSMYPVLLSVELGAGPADALRSVKERLRAVPARGMGYGLLRYLHEDDRVRRQLATLPEAQVAFLYLGQAGAGGGDDDDQDGVFARADESTGPEQSPRAERSHLLEIMGGVVGGRLHMKWNYSTSVHEQATIEMLAGHFADALRELISQPAAASDDRHPLSFAQQRLWFLEQLGVGAAYNMPLVIRLTGPLDAGALERGLATVVERHEVLRTTFAAVDGTPVQVIAPALDLPFPVVDLRDLPEAAREGEAQRRAIEKAARPFDLARGPLLRPVLYRLRDDEHILLLAMHHIVTDGWSLGVLARELTELYRAFGAGESPNLPDLSMQYADFARWQTERLQGAALEEHLSYWREHLGGDLPVLQLPTDHARPALQTFEAATQTFLLPAAVSKALKEHSREHGVTLAITLMAAFKTLLSGYTGQEDVIVGSPIANRTREELEHLIGFFVNTLAMRTDLSGAPTFSELLRREKKVALGAYEHQDLPFERLVEELAPDRDLSQTPIFSVMFAMENAPREGLQLGDVTITPVDLGWLTTRFDLEVYLRELPGGLRAMLVYNRDLFDASTMERMGRHFANLLTAVAEDPSRRVSELSLLDEAERHQILVDWNDTATAYPDDKCVHELFEAQVARTPDAVAVTCGSESLTYAELNARANRVAHHLRSRGGGPNVLVGLCAERSLEMVVGLLGILKAGAAYVPLDPAYPASRLTFTIEDARMPLLLTQPHLAGTLPAGSATIVPLEPGTWADEPATNPPRATTASDPAYVIYTSGSTGQPKGVVVEHRQVTRLFAATEPWFGFDENDVWTLFHSCAFDFSVWEIWGALLYGGRLVVVPYEVSRSPADFHALVFGEGVTVLNQTPSAFRQFARANTQSNGSELLSLRLVIFGGEALELQSLRPWIERHGDERPRLVNMYGITETTVHVTYRAITRRDLDDAPGSLIGKPLPDLRVCILDRHGQLTPIGVPGELYVGGAGVARGYLDRPQLTAQRFVPDPFSQQPGARLYRTGDVGRRLAGGDLEYLGRNDDQVKIRGFRIELGEVEAALVQHARVREAVVLPWDTGTDHALLVGYVVLAEGATATMQDLKSHLADRLPKYMVPDVVMPLDSLPRTPNGKLDRKALPPPQATRDDAIEYVAPESPMEGESDELWLIQQELAEIWREVLPVERIGRHDSFFNLGGHSLLATQLVARIRDRFEVELTLRTVFDAPTLDGMSREVLQLLLENESGGDEFE